MRTKTVVFAACTMIACLLFAGCEASLSTAPVAASGVKEAHASVQTGSDGLTVEQRNVQQRLAMDNKPGSIKHLYIISAYSGQVLIYSTVRGKVTSSGKRLTPTTVSTNQPESTAHNGISVMIDGRDYRTGEVLQDDGTYGSSVEYVYWWDSKGVYHQQYITGGMIFHVSDQPLAVKSIVLNMELSRSEQ